MRSISALEREKMKKIFFGIAMFTMVTAVSCKKEDAVAPQNSTGNATIHVEYRISSESGKVNAEYLKPNSDGIFETEQEAISRNYYSVFFDTTPGHFLSVQASNVAPSHTSVQVEIYIDGQLKVQDITNDPSKKAIAQGNF